MPLRYCFHQGTSIDTLKSGPRIAVIIDLDPLWGLWGQLRFWPGPSLAYMYSQNPNVKARPVLAARALIDCSDVLQALSLQSQGSNSTIYEERFQLFFLSCNVPGAQLGFQFNLCKWATHKCLLSRMFQSSRSFPSRDGICGISEAAGKRELALVRSLPVSQERQVPVCGERGCSGSPSVYASLNTCSLEGKLWPT